MEDFGAIVRYPGVQVSDRENRGVRHPFFNLEQFRKGGVIRNDSDYRNLGWSTGGVKGFLSL